VIDSAVMARKEMAGEGDRRRMANAAAHCRGVRLGVLCVHAVAMEKGGASVLLLGGHGAGKSLTALALGERGWRVVAGDVALVHVALGGMRPALVGGTRQFLVRPEGYQRWFAHREAGQPRGEGAEARLDVTASVSWMSSPVGEIPLRLAVLVAVDGGIAGVCQSVLSRHTSASVWFRASSHLLDRVLDDEGAEPLRCLEHPRLAVARMALVRAAACALPLRSMFGTPQVIADAIDMTAVWERTNG
jgi:hypothetical protein